jgi:hypothetical protein
MSDRTWIGEALAAYDQGLARMGEIPGMPSPEFWVSRAQAAAAIASAEQARIGNLIAWKALQTQLGAGHGLESLPTDGDEISAQIRAGLGLA